MSGTKYLSTRFRILGDNNEHDRRIVLGVIVDIKNKLLKNPENDKTPIFFGNKDDYLYRKKGADGKIVSPSRQYNDFFIIEVQNDVEDNHEILRQVENSFHGYIISDTEANYRASILSQRRKITLRVTYGNKSRALIDGIVSELNTLGSGDDVYLVHKLEYGFMVPNNLIDFIREIYNIKHTIYPNLTFEEYLVNIADNRLSDTNSTSGNILNNRLAIRERLVDVAGYITDTVSTIKSETDTETSMTSFSFSYEFVYDSPYGIKLEFQPMVFNKMLSSKFIKGFENSGIPNASTLRGLPTMYDVRYTKNVKKYENIPCYDPGLPDSLNDNINRLVVILIQVDPNDPTHVDDINNFDFLACMKNCLLREQGDYISRLGEYLVYFELYKDDYKQPDGSLIINEVGEIRTKEPMIITSLYRLSVSVVTNMSTMTPYGKQRMIRCGTYTDRSINVDYIRCLLTMLGIDQDKIDEIIRNLLDDIYLPEQILCELLGCNNHNKRYTITMMHALVALRKINGK